MPVVRALLVCSLTLIACACALSQEAVSRPARDSIDPSKLQLIGDLLGQIQSLTPTSGQFQSDDSRRALVSRLRNQASQAKADSESSARQADVLEAIGQAFQRIESPGGSAESTAAQLTRSVDFARDIRPLFEARCHGCHGKEKSKSGLRLDRKADALRGGDSGVVIVPGKSADSRLISFVSGSMKNVIMPPTGERLAAEQISLLRTWIDGGANWPDDESTASTHWAYQKPTQPALPNVKQSSWPRNEVDRFVLAKLEAEGLQPSRPATRERLIRRVTFDLTGLPPTLAEVDAFVLDAGPNAFEKVVDRLLASPHYGERMARVWLDLARYADTNGYHVDRARSMWKYREWVIDAFNRNAPYDQFTIEQLAGDLLPNTTIAQKIASGFNRNTMFNEEGGVDPEEFRDKVVVDRVNTCMTVWMGSTFGCAQCHSHKYDPFSQKEFYQLYAFFNNTSDVGGGTYASIAPLVELPTPEQQIKQDGLLVEIARLEAELKADSPRFIAAESEWEQKILAAGNPWIIIDPIVMISREGALFERQPDHSILVTGPRPERDRYVLSFHTDLTSLTGVRLEALADPRIKSNGPGRSDNGNFVLSEVGITVAPEVNPGDTRPVAIETAVADFSQDQFPIANTIGHNGKTGWAIAPQMGKPHTAVFQAKQPFGFAGGSTVTVSLNLQYGEGHTLGKFRISLTSAAKPLGATSPPAEVIASIKIDKSKRTPEQQKAIVEYFRSVSPELAKVNQELGQLKAQADELKKQIITSLVLEELPKPRKTQIHVRGDFLNPGDEVQAVTPAVFHPFPSDQPRNRLGLARWLVDANNPMVGRVTVNRFWEMLFGHGIVETCEDFGTQGVRPTHAELLDWLATDFTRDWDVKRLLKLMVMSATYQQGGDVTAALLEKDPYNKLYARGPRFRLEVEMIRDQAMAVSGLLSLKIGGPSVYPYQPDGLWEEKGLNTFDSSKWITSKGEALYRRAMYTYMRRSVPYPTMLAFDSPTREFCCVRRPRTNTPLQALTTLNDPVYVEAARVFAQRIMKESGPDVSARITYAFRSCLARTPTEAELQRLVSLFKQQHENYKSDKQAAALLIKNGEFPRPDKVDESELAAWTVVTNVLLNLDETVTKG